MQELHELELTLLENLTAKYPQFKSHLPFLKVAERKLTASGLDVNLEYVDFNGEFDETNALFSNGGNIQIKGLKEGLSYVIDITVGQITSIEFSTYNEKWDGKFTDFKILEKE
ncbi:hypothetical protein LUD75_13975 [Epilithonimonas sp. JDS]|uniref:hypothetical protein n=1 Tax=Epilithonimonas sp. JDS TaxID=2902797 RepID=UPI001E58305C|nr:hypothetical protein [Epilithonimonas sp. JDS]MCD9855828.1 hypothetical protein [Epilithonimonas sp. JDS]